MGIREYIRRCWHGVAITIEDLDDRFDYLEDKLIEIWDTIMATIEALKISEDASLAAVTKFIGDVNTEFTTLTAEIADLTAKLANTPGVLDAAQQAQLDAINASAVAISAAVAEADAKLTSPAPVPAPAPVA